MSRIFANYEFIENYEFILYTHFQETAVKKINRWQGLQPCHRSSSVRLLYISLWMLHLIRLFATPVCKERYSSVKLIAIGVSTKYLKQFFKTSVSMQRTTAYCNNEPLPYLFLHSSILLFFRHPQLSSLLRTHARYTSYTFSKASSTWLTSSSPQLS